MSGRRLAYVVGVSLLAIIFSLPQLCVAFVIAMNAYQNGNWLDAYTDLIQIPGIGDGASYYCELDQAPFWKDHFVTVEGIDADWTTGPMKWKLWGTDPETGEATDMDVHVDDPNWIQPVVAGDRLWLVGPAGSYEVIDGVPKPFAMTLTTGSPHLIWNGAPAHLHRRGNGDFVMTTYTSGAWTTVGSVALPGSNRTWFLDGVRIDFTSPSSVECLQRGDGLHLFAIVGDNVLYRDRLEINPKSPSLVSAYSTAQPSVEPVSALRPVNTDDDLAGWSVICLAKSRRNSNLPSLDGFTDRRVQGMFVEGQPAAVVVVGVNKGQPEGHVFRYDGKSWSNVATQSFPFGARNFRTVTTSDGQRSYLVVSTSTGASHIYAVEATGIRKTNGTRNESNQAIEQLEAYLYVPLVVLGCGSILGLCVWFLMWLCTKPDYGFGTQNIKLGSVGLRGLARLIDLGLIAFSTIALGWAMTIKFDWVSLLEALNLHVDHPTVATATRVAFMLTVWLAFVVTVMLITQAKWGVTPGKWLCRLRTVRTSLRPCGVAAALAREVCFLFDCFGFLCWTPGILCIAFTDCRQRFGDLVADTIVVDARSLAKGE